jgi:hypothetical protein
MLLVRSLSFLTSGAWRHGGRRVNWARVAGVIYDKFDGEFASRSQTYASTGTVRYGLMAQPKIRLGTPRVNYGTHSLYAKAPRRAASVGWPSREAISRRVAPAKEAAN